MDKKYNTDLKTLAFVMRRTNYAEADRILNLLTPEGKISAMAKGVRRARSKLAGGVELFTLAEVNLHFGRGELATLTGAKMMRFYKGILGDFERMELASEILKKTERAMEGTESSEYFKIVKSVFEQLDAGMDVRIISKWFILNLVRAMGEQINFYTDTEGQKLEGGAFYSWDENEKALRRDADGMIDENGIKILRLMVTADLVVIKRIREVEKYLPEISKVSKVFEEVVK